MASAEKQLLKPTEGNIKAKTSLIGKLTYVKENITIEPVITCYAVSKSLILLATQNLNLDKACRVNQNYGSAVCDALIARQGNQYVKEELEVQQLIASIERWKSILYIVIPCLLILFIGAWSDRTGKRKICMLIPIFGNLLLCLSNILSTYYFYEIPLEVTMFFEAFFPAVTGAWFIIYMGAFISDASSEESRTFRVGIVSLCLTIGKPIGSVLCGVLLKHIKFYGVFSFSLLLSLSSLLYGIYYVKDPKKPEKAEKKKSNFRGFLKSFFDMKHVKDTLTVAFKNGPNHRRTKSILVLESIVFIYGPYHGELIVQYLFTRYRFNWDALTYSFYNTFCICIHSLGALISISLFSHRLKWDDSVLGLISMIRKVIGALATGFARNSTEMYIAAAIEMFNATSFTAIRSISSKLCTSDELGKMTSFFNVVEVFMSMVFGPIYSWIYMFTLKYDVGIVYYVSTVLTIPNLVIFGWFFLQRNKKPNIKPDESMDDEEEEELNDMKHQKASDLLSTIDNANKQIL